MRLRWLLGLLWMAWPPLWASAPEGLTLEECVQLAENAPSTVTQARLLREAAGAEVQRAQADFFPRLHFANGYIYNSPLRGAADGSHSFITLDGMHAYNSVLSAGLELDTSGRLRAQVSKSRAQQQLAQAELRLASRDLRRQVAAAYYRLLLARHLSEVAAATLAEAQQFEQRSRLLFEKGEAARADLVQATAESASRRQALQAAQLEEQLANHALAAFWTEQVETPVALHDVLAESPKPPPDADSLQPPGTAAAILARPEFQLLDARTERSRADVRIARAGLFPQAMLVGQYGLDSNQWTLHDRGYAFFLNLEIPLFDWFKSTRAARVATLENQRIETERQMARRAFSQEYRDAVARATRLFEQIALAKTQRDLLAESLRLSRLRYESGEGSALDVLTIQSRWSDAGNNYFVTLAGYWNALADLEVARGQ